MAGVFALEAKDLRTFAGQIESQRALLNFDPKLSNAFAPSQLPGSLALALAHKESTRLLAHFLTRLDRLLLAFGWLAQWCAQEFPRLDDSSARGLASSRGAPNALPQALRNMPSADGSREPSIDPRFRVLIPSSPKRRYVMKGIDPKVPFPVLGAWIHEDLRNVGAIEPAAEGWQNMSGLFDRTVSWLQGQTEFVSSAFRGNTATDLVGRMLRATDDIGAYSNSIYTNSLLLPALKLRVEETHESMTEIYDEFYTSPKAQTVEIVTSVPLIDELGGGVLRDRWHRMAHDRALEVMRPLNTDLGEGAKALVGSAMGPSTSWPQADPGKVHLR